MHLGIDGHKSHIEPVLHTRVHGLRGEHQVEAGRPHDGQRLLPALQMQRAQQPKQAKIMVAVQVRDKDDPQRAKAAAVLEQPPLRALAAVDEVAAFAHSQQLGRGVAARHGGGGGAAQYLKLELHG